MTISTKITSSDNPLAPDNSSIVALVGPSIDGTVNAVYQFDPGAEPYDDLGDGQLSEDAAFLLSQGASVVAIPAATTAGSIGAVTHRNAANDGAGTGPVLTLGGTPHLDLPLLKATIKTGGDRDSGAAVIGFAFDGSTDALDVPIPPAPQATLIGTVDLTALTIATLDGETLKFTPDDHAQFTVTFGTPATIQDVIDAINAAAVAATSAMRASLYQGKFLKVASGTHGTGSTLSLDATSTADTTLGLSNAAAAGANATMTLPFTGITVTFASGTYLEGETYAAAIVGPHCDQTAIIAAANALRSNGAPFGFFLNSQPASDGAGLRALADALGPVLSEWAQGSESIFEAAVLAGPLGGTGASAIQANDNDVKAGMLGHTNPVITIAHGDAYVPGHRVQGEHRRSHAVALAARLATQSLSKDPGYGAFGPIAGVNMTAPDGVTKARNEATATVKMGGSKGPGFTVLTTKSSNPYVVHGVTRAGSASRYVHQGVLRMALRAAQVLFFALQAYENWDPLLGPTGTIRGSDADVVDGALNEVLAEAIIREPNSHASAAAVTVDRTEKVSDTDNITVTALIQMKGQAENIKLVVTTSGTFQLLAA